MLPFLRYLADGEEHGLSETHDVLAEQFKLTADEVRELLPSGRQSRRRCNQLQRQAVHAAVERRHQLVRRCPPAR